MRMHTFFPATSVYFMQLSIRLSFFLLTYPLHSKSFISPAKRVAKSSHWKFSICEIPLFPCRYVVNYWGTDRNCMLKELSMTSLHNVASVSLSCLQQVAVEFVWIVSQAADDSHAGHNHSPLRARVSASSAADRTLTCPSNVLAPPCTPTL